MEIRDTRPRQYKRVPHANLAKKVILFTYLKKKKFGRSLQNGKEGDTFFPTVKRKRKRSNPKQITYTDQSKKNFFRDAKRVNIPNKTPATQRYLHENE